MVKAEVLIVGGARTPLNAIRTLAFRMWNAFTDSTFQMLNA
jgi:hypothetical protein